MTVCETENCATDEHRTQSRRRVLLAVASVASLMCALDTLVVSTALTTIRLDLGASVEALEWTVNAYNLALAVLLVPAASLGDRYGRRRMFAAGLGLFVAASAVCALAPDATLLALARAVQGAGAALVTALGMALVAAAYPPERRGAALGVLQGVTGLAVLAGPGLGGLVTSTLGWEWIFWLNVPIGLLLLPVVLRTAGEGHDDESRPLDVTGVLLVTGAALGLLWALSRGNPVGWSAPEVVGAALVGLLLLGLFLRRQARVAAPVIPPHLLRVRGFVAGNLATIGLYASIFGGVFFYSQLLAVSLGFTPLEAGLGLFPWTSALFVLGPLAGRLADRIGNRPVGVAGLVLAAAGTAWIALVAEPGVTYPDLIGPFVLSAVGGSGAMPALASAVLARVGPADVGAASGVTSMVRELGGVLGLAVLVAVFAGHGGYADPAAFLAGFAPAMGVCAAVVAAGALAAAFLPARKELSA
ncbi:MFS transporter [Actinomycetospora sp. OC33-EN08]|uniref:MFS transporter n=1 Tax=Actinomycetospora aurantiaca TaxID=3129233 RepID=A0ABU8MKR0_9PSEU